MAAIIAIAAIIGIVVLIEVLQSSAKTATTGSTATSQQSQAAGASSSGLSVSGSSASGSATSTYKDGTYTADESYYVPHGSEDITVTLTVANGVVTDSSIVNSESDHDSARYQEEFAAEYKSSVVGKSLANLKLSYVAGASDTTDGFNTALDQIRTQAEA